MDRSVQQRAPGWPIARIVRKLAAAWIAIAIFMWLASGWWGFWWSGSKLPNMRVERGQIMFTNSPITSPVYEVVPSVRLYEDGWGIENVEEQFQWWFQEQRGIGFYELRVPIWPLAFLGLLAYFIATQLDPKPVDWPGATRKAVSVALRITSWVFVAVVCLVIAAWFVSIWWQVKWVDAPAGYDIGISSGRVWIFRGGQAYGISTVGTSNFQKLSWLRYTAPQIYWRFEHTREGERTWTFVPLWSFALGSVSFAYGAWWLGRRFRVIVVDTCACGYSRQGVNEDVPCPECGVRNEENIAIDVEML